MRKNILFFFICNFAAYILAFPHINTISTYGGNGNDVGIKFVSAEDGGIIIAGYTNSSDGDVKLSHGEEDFWVLKLDRNFEIEWEKTYGGSRRDIAQSIIRTSDSNYLIVGLSESNDGDVTGNNGLGDYWVIKIDCNGELLWQRCFGGTQQDHAYDVVETENEEVLIAGYTRSNEDKKEHEWGEDGWILRLDKSGNFLSQKILNGAERSEDLFRSIKLTTNGGFVAIGYTNYKDVQISCNYVNEQAYVCRFDKNGELEWSKDFGGRFLEGGFDIIETSDECFLMVGEQDAGTSMFSNGLGGKDFWILKIDSTGNELWSKNYGGSFTDIAHSVIEIQEDNYVVVGQTTSTDKFVEENHGKSDAWIMMIDNSGELLWSKTVGGSMDDSLLSITEFGNSFLAVGYSMSFDGDVSENKGSKDLLVVSVIY